MTEPFDWAGLAIEAHNLVYRRDVNDAAAYLRERIEAAFVPVAEADDLRLQLAQTIMQQDEEWQKAKARAEAAEAKCVKLWALLDDIDTLDDACRGEDDLFRTLTRAAQQKRHAIMSGEEWDTARAALGGEHADR